MNYEPRASFPLSWEKEANPTGKDEEEERNIAGVIAMPEYGDLFALMRLTACLRSFFSIQWNLTKKKTQYVQLLGKNERRRKGPLRKKPFLEYGPGPLEFEVKAIW